MMAPGVAHLLARRGGDAGDVGDHRLGHLLAMNSAAFSSSDPPISPNMEMARVSGSASKAARQSTKLVPGHRVAADAHAGRDADARAA